MNILVTGGAGYIGSAAADALLKEGHSVTIIDSLVSGHRDAIPKGADFFQIDLADEMSLSLVFKSKKTEAVMHFAASIEAGESMKAPGQFFKNNMSNSLLLLELAYQAGAQYFVLSSTAAVYAPSSTPIGEDAAIDPANVYGFTKYSIEQALEWYRRIYGLRFASLRYFNACGALPNHGEDHRPESHLIPLTLKVALGQSQEITIFGTDYQTPDGTCIRDYIHIDDLVSAHSLSLEALKNHDRLIYNLGNGNGYSVRQVIETARKVTGHPIPMNEAARRPGDAPRLVASSEKIRTELGWVPKHPELLDIMESAWIWHKTHPNGYEG